MKWLCLVAFLSIFQCAFALKKEDLSPVDSLEEKIKKLERFAGINPKPEKTTFNLFGQFCYSKASLDGVAYATTGVLVEAAGSGGAGIFDKFKTRTVHFNYDPGFQIGIGVGLPHDRWDIQGRWMRRHTKGHDVAHADQVIDFGNKAIFDVIGTIQPIIALDISATKAKADCQLNVDVVDAILGRNLLWSKYFWFHPFVGVRCAWVKLDWDIAFTMPIQTPSQFLQAFSDLDVDNDYKGVGLIGGFDSKWNFYRGFGLFSHASASLVYGPSKEITKQTLTIVPPGQSERFPQKLTAHNSTHAVKAVFDIALGLKWEKKFYKKTMIMVWGGYDFFYWPNVTQKTISQASRTRDRSDMSFQGIILGARAEF